MQAQTKREKYLTTGQAAARCGVHVNTIRAWVERGILDPVQVVDKGWFRFPETQVESIMAEKLSDKQNIY